ncbi:MAG: CBS domain-containing protein [Candidatus Rokubacteria bacterium]|nr:CBS domain-containing protein [Candidatus Rokubacteria bacterium]
MSRNVATIEDSESCHAAVNRMIQRKIRHLPVVDRQGALVGIVTDRDLRHHLFEPRVFKEIGSVSVDALLKAVPVREIMSAPVTTVGPGDELEDAARKMLEDKIGSLPVVDGGRVVGIITETDLLQRICRADPGSAECEAIVVSFP